MEAWTQFFIRAGIPEEVSKKYAKSFKTNRITKEMLPELDKSTLTELGVTAIGDQLCILRRIKAAKSALERSSESDEESEPKKTLQKPNKSRITGPESHTSNSTISTASESRRGKPPPDRNEIYHVKMPSGNTMRTRKIMRKAEEMRQQGLAVRGTTGVRKGGRSVSPIDKTSLAARIVKKQSAEVSSSTDRGDRIHHHHHHSNGTKIARIGMSSIKKTITNRPSLSSRLTSSTSGSSSGIRIHVEKGKSRIAGRLQKPNPVILKSGRHVSESVVVEYPDDDEYEDEVMEEIEYEEDDQELYEAVMAETDDVLNVPTTVHQRITYTAPRHRDVSKSSESVFSRVSYQRR